MGELKRRFTPFLTFHGRAEEAMNFYASVLPDSRIESIVRFDKGGRGDEGKVLTGVLSAMGQQIMFMDMNAEYDCPAFSWTTSFYLEFTDESEYDATFNSLAQGGFVMMKEEPFMQFRKVAWVTDRFGVTWQPVLL